MHSLKRDTRASVSDPTRSSLSPPALSYRCGHRRFSFFPGIKHKNCKQQLVPENWQSATSIKGSESRDMKTGRLYNSHLEKYIIFIFSMKTRHSNLLLKFIMLYLNSTPTSDVKPGRVLFSLLADNCLNVS